VDARQTLVLAIRRRRIALAGHDEQDNDGLTLIV